MPPTLTLALAGDVMLGRVVNRMIGDFGFSYPWGEILSVIRDTDHFLINLECALTDLSERAVADVRRQADLVIFSIHWGPNMRPRPPAAFRTFARRIIDAGAGVFWGHSAHVIQGVEIWHGKPILYDTGDFVDDYVVDPELRNDLSRPFLLRAQPPVITRIDVLLVAIGRCQVNRARGADRDWFDERFTSLCAELGTDVVSDETSTVPVDASPEQGEEASV